MKKLNISIGTLIVTVLLLAGCSSKTQVESDLHIDGAPDWVNEGNQMLNDEDGRLFHGIGSAPPMGDHSLQKNTVGKADFRPRKLCETRCSGTFSLVSEINKRN